MKVKSLIDGRLLDWVVWTTVADTLHICLGFESVAFGLQFLVLHPRSE